MSIRGFKDIECPDCGVTLEVEFAYADEGEVTHTADCPICDEVITFEA